MKNVLGAATPGDNESFHQAWSKVGNRVYDEADQAAQLGSRATARRAYLRAFNYLRTSEFFLKPSDQRKLPAYKKAVKAFRQSLEFFDHKPLQVKVPFENSYLPGYLFTPAVCITSSKKIAEELPAQIEDVLRRLPTRDIARISWQDYGEIIHCDTREEMLSEAERICSDHVQVMTEDPDWFLQNMTNYGALFLGHRTNVSYGDKVIGTNHTLPTQRAGRYTGGLWVGKFIKTHSYQRILTDEASVLIGEYCSRLCALEHFAGHQEQVDIRVRRFKKTACPNFFKPGVSVLFVILKEPVPSGVPSASRFCHSERTRPVWRANLQACRRHIRRDGFFQNDKSDLETGKGTFETASS